MDKRVRLSLAMIAACMLVSSPVRAQTGIILGTVVASDSGTPVSGASIEIHTPGAAPLAALSDVAGHFRRELPAGGYSIIVRSLGMETTRIDVVNVRAGETTEVRIPLTAVVFVLNPVVVSASRRQEKVLDAPAAISVVRRADVQRRIGMTVDEHVRTVPGMDVAATGLLRRSVVARGFNDTYSTALLLLTDYRYANNPSTRLNAFYMMPVNDLDIDRIEISLGPGSALYGPNATNGVLHTFTKSPIDDPGTSVSLAGGERSVFQGAFRTAFQRSGRVGFKLSGQYFDADDWRWTDPVEEALAAADPSNTGIGTRDFRARRWNGEARIDVRTEGGAELVGSVGTNMALNGIEVSGAGRALVKDFRSSYVQARFRTGRFFTQAFFNFADAGDSRLLRTGLAVVDHSRVLAFQAQHGRDVGPVSLVYGIDAQRTDTRTDGTFTGRFEQDDVVDEAGAYVHAVGRLSERVEAVAALRLDGHNRLERPVLSPRAAIVYQPAAGHTLRATFNRAFRTPAVLDLFLDLQAGRLPITQDLFFDLRAVGVGTDGYTFNTCAGGYRSLCMRVPGTPGELPANATLVWDRLIAAFAPDLAPVLPNPGTMVGTVLRRFDPEGAATGAPFRLDPAGPQTIDPLRPTITNTVEAGYKGLLGERALVTASLYYSRLRDFVGPITVETPNVFLDPDGTATYVNARLAPLVAAGTIDQATVNALIAGLAGVPVGSVTPAQWDAPDILLTYRNLGRASLWGFEVGGDLRATERVSLAGSVGFTSTECFDFDDDGRCGSAADRSLNAPSWKGNASVRWDNVAAGLSAGTTVRLVDGFPQATGVFVGEIPGYALLDITAGYRLARVPGATLTLNATNLLDNRHRELIGAPEIGRLILLRLRYDF